MTKIIVLPEEVFESHMKILLNRIDELEKKIDRQQLPDEKLKIGQVWELLKQHGIEYANAQNAKGWLKKNNIRMVEGESTCAYYWKSEVLECLFICAKQNKGESKCRSQCGWCEGNN